MNPRFAIPNPCPKKWADLEGEGRERHCELCGKSVHAMDQYSGEEWAQLWHESNGRVCGYMGAETAPEPRSRRAVLMGALLTAIAPLMAQTGRVRIRVTDATGAVIPTAEASLLAFDNRPIRTAKADEAGEILLIDLPLGNCRFRVSAAGFASRTLTITIANSEELQLDAKLEVGPLGEIVIVEAQPIKKTRR